MSITSILLKAIVSVAILIFTSYIAPWLKEKRIYNYVDIAVRAAEQMIREAGKGSEKYMLVESWLVDKFKITIDEAKQVIEAAVYEMNLEKNF